MNEITYKETKEMLMEDYMEFTEEGYTPAQSIAAMLEDSINFMLKSDNNYINSVIGLSIISLEKGILPDYLYERLLKLDNNNYQNYDVEDVKTLSQDKLNINQYLNDQNYKLIADELYKARVNMLLKEQ